MKIARYVVKKFLFASALVVLFDCLPASAYTVVSSTVLQSDGSAADTQSAINAASDKYTIQLPAGTFTWTSGVTLAGKGIKIQGAGGGRVDGASKSSLAIGTGAKSFAIWKAANGSGVTLSSVVNTFTPGETIRAVYKPDGTQFMEGTVTSYDGSTLVLNITKTGGSGTFAAWNFTAAAATTILHNAGASALFAVTEDDNTNIEFQDFAFASGGGTGAFITLHGLTTGSPFIWHDSRVTNTNGNRIIDADTPRGLIYHAYWETGFRANAVNLSPGYGLVVHSSVNTAPWNTTSKMGTNDTDGLQNFYVEQSFFSQLMTECFDSDGGSRMCVRDSVFDSSGFTSHGADTGPIGQRHFQYYDNLCIFEDLGTSTIGMGYWIYFRGGTAVITDNVMPDIKSGQWGDKAEIILTAQQLQRNAGPNPLWGAGINGIQYPSPRQVGMGYVTGKGTDGEGRSSDSVTYVGDSEPVHQWNNTGGGDYASPGVADYAAPTAGQDSTADYIQVGRDYLNSPLAGFVKYPYPHPLRNVTVSNTPPTNAKVSVSVK